MKLCIWIQQIFSEILYVCTFCEQRLKAINYRLDNKQHMGSHELLLNNAGGLIKPNNEKTKYQHLVYVSQYVCVGESIFSKMVNGKIFGLHIFRNRFSNYLNIFYFICCINIIHAKELVFIFSIQYIESILSFLNFFHKKYKMLSVFSTI